MDVAGLFSGIGGFELGLRDAGHGAVLMVENAPAAAAVLSARFPDVGVQHDVRNVRNLPVGVEVLSAGFPCQDLSQAGRTLGLAGPNSGLVSEVLRLVDGARPPWLLLENVPFMLRLHAGQAALAIVAALDALGYRWCWRVVDLLGFSLPQRRLRLLIVASRVSDPADVLLVDDADLARPETAIGTVAHGFYWTEGRGGLGWAVDSIPTLKAGSTLGIPSAPAILLPGGHVVTPDFRDAERLQGFPPGWTDPAVAAGLARARWSLAGNALPVPISRWLGARLMAPGLYDRSRDMPMPGSKLPDAARSDGRRRWAVEAGRDPLGLRPPHLADFLRYEGLPLSRRATAGFLERTRRSSLRFPPDFLPAIEEHLRVAQR